jgi:predicted DNA repair protein MutK
LEAQLADPAVNLVDFERGKIKGAIRTDFVLSAEIIVLTLGIVASSNFATQVAVVSGIAILMTVGVYGLVAVIVKLDDAGLYLTLKRGRGGVPGFQRWVGARLLSFAPWLMKALAVVGTAAMFLVGGGILVHGLHPVAVGVEHIAAWLGALEPGGTFLQAITPTLLNALFGIFAGAIVLGCFSLWSSIRGIKSD